jgi:hypothetical protein
MNEIALNILCPEEIARLKTLLREVVSTLPKQQRGCEVQALVAERLLKLAGAGEKDPLALKRRVLISLRDAR